LDSTIKDKISMILFAYDSINLHAWNDDGIHNAEEYDPEASMIVPENQIAQ
jgi:hypothetical protein